MKALRALTVTVLTIAVLVATTIGTAFAVRWYADRQAEPAAAGAVAPTPTPTPTTPVQTGTPATAPTPSEPSAPEFVLSQGDDGGQVRELQHRLFQLAWWPELTTGTYDGATREAVRGFQTKRGLEATGQVDDKTWKRLTAMTETPTHDEKFNVLTPGPALYATGAEGEEVRGVQARLKQIAWLFGEVTGSYDAATVDAVRGFQGKREIPVTGEVDQRTFDRLVAMTYTPTYEEMHNIEPKPAALDPRCKTGRVLCIDKSSQSLRWVIDGKAQETFEVRFGSDELPTREGAFSVFSKSRDHVSSLYDTSMPFAMFFSGGQAVHYSPDFAAHGYAGASHGCVNVRDYDGVARLFGQVQIGDRVIVYRS